MQITLPKSRVAALLGTSLLGAALLLGCTQQKANTPDTPKQHTTLVELGSFNNAALPSWVKPAAADITPQTQGDYQGWLKVNFASKDNLYSGIVFEPEQPWDWSQYKDFSLAMDIANEGDVSTTLFLDITDIDGATYTRSIVVPVGGAHTYYGKMQGQDLDSPDPNSDIELNFASGLRGNPPTWQGYNDRMAISLWGKKNLNLKGIKKVSLSVQYALRDREITLGNVRLIKNPPMDPAFLTNIVDRYGQNAKQEFPQKIHNDAELLAQRDAELDSLKAGKPAGRSKFNGWLNGPKLKATGFFRTEKVDGKWWLVDPEGYLYFGTGVDIIRLANSSTMTGYDFAPGAIAERHADDLTPEDSASLNRAPASAIPTRFKASELRANMFEWLPSYDEPLGKHFGYRREAHSGPMQHGETFSFYAANLERKYGEHFMDAWRKVSVDRMLNWGFSALGNWTDPSFYHNDRIPYFANGWIIGNFKTISSGNDFWAPLPDVFDPEFERRTYATVAQVAKEVGGSPWCVGVFIDNEKSFGRSETLDSQLGIVIYTLGQDAADTPTKAAFTKQMQQKYNNIEALNKAWQTQIASWDAFAKGFDSKLTGSADQQHDYEALLYSYGEKYFATVNKAMKELMPNHLYLGSRFADWGMPMPIVKAAAANTDVISFNNYKDGLPKKRWAFLAELDRPSIIGEFHFGTTESGLFHPGLLATADQKDRARAYEEYMHSVIDNPYMVGAHWFQYMDSPITGRAFDGENYNVGFVNVADVPYQPLVDTAKKLHADMYKRRYQTQK